MTEPRSVEHVAMVPLDPAGLDGVPVGRFADFTIGELQAIVFAFSVAGAYADPATPPAWRIPVWRDVALEAARALERVALAEAAAAAEASRG